MKAARIHKFGGPEVISIDEVDEPRARDKHLLVKVGASSLNHIDLSMRGGEMKALTRFRLPFTLGFDVAGEVVDCGPGVTSFLPGDRIVAMTGYRAGTAADYCLVPQGKAAILPEGIEWAEAAALPLAGATALQGLRSLGRLRKGQTVLINGASGGVGCFAVQIARLLNARVIAVCREKHFSFVRDLGADQTIDYEKQEITELGENFHVVFDAAAKLDPEKAKILTKAGGHFVSTRPQPKQVLEGLKERLRGSIHMHFFVADERPNDFSLLLRLHQAGKLKPCVNRTFPLSSAADAHAYLQNESVAGKVILQPS